MTKEKYKEVYVCNIVNYKERETWTRVFFEEYDAKDFCKWNIREHLSAMDLEKSDFDEEDLSEELDYMFDRKNWVEIYRVPFLF
jgi:hypothetical protein